MLFILFLLSDNEAHDIHDYQQHRDTPVSKIGYIKLYRSTMIYSPDFVCTCKVFRLLHVASCFRKTGEHVEKTKEVFTQVSSWLELSGELEMALEQHVQW